MHCIFNSNFTREWALFIKGIFNSREWALLILHDHSINSHDFWAALMLLLLWLWALSRFGLVLDLYSESGAMNNRKNLANLLIFNHLPSVPCN